MKNDLNNNEDNSRASKKESVKGSSNGNGSSPAPAVRINRFLQRQKNIDAASHEDLSFVQ